MINLYFLDLLGVASFAFFGAYVAEKKRFDLFGIFVCALLTGLGGGTIREIILGKIPVYLTDYNYIIAVGIGMGLAMFLYKYFQKIQGYFLIVDAVGLSTFAFIGAERANQFGLSSLAVIFFAVITAVGGGILRDIAMNEAPSIFKEDFYASCALFLGILFAVFRNEIENVLVAYSILISTFLLRVMAIKYNLKLWRRGQI